MSLTFIDLETITMQTVEKLLCLNKNWSRWSWVCWSPGGRCEGWWAQWTPGGGGAAQGHQGKVDFVVQCAIRRCSTMCTMEVARLKFAGDWLVQTWLMLIIGCHWIQQPWPACSVHCHTRNGNGAFYHHTIVVRCFAMIDCVCFIHMYSFF